MVNKRWFLLNSRYSGNFREIGIMIDEVCSWVWTNIFYPLTEEGMQKAVVLSRRLALRFSKLLCGKY